MRFHNLQNLDQRERLLKYTAKSFCFYGNINLCMRQMWCDFEICNQVEDGVSLVSLTGGKEGESSDHCPSLLCDEQEDEEEESYRGDDETGGEEGGDIEEWDTGQRGGERVEEEEENGGEMEKNGEMGEDGVTEREKESEVVVDFEEEGGEMEKRQLRKRIGRAEKEKEEEAVLIEDRRGSVEEMKDRRERDEKVEEEKKQKGVMGPALSLDLVGVTTDPVGMTTTTHEDSGYLSSGMGFYCPPGPLLFHTQPKPHPQPLLPSGVKRPHSVSPPPPPTQSLQVKVTRVYSTRRSIGYSARGRGQVLPLPLLPAVTMGDPSLLPSLPKKKTRTLYSTDQLEQLEGMFQEDHYPDGEKRKEIAATVGVTPQRIMVWFQNRRAKWRKASRSAVKPEHKQTCSRLPDPNPTSLLAPHPRAAAGHIAPFLPPAGLSLPLPPTTQALPSYSTLLASLSSSPTGRSVGERGPPSGPQGGSVEHLPPIMYSPPPLRRASLPLLTTFLNPPKPTPSPTPPTLQPTPTSPFFMDVLEPHPPNRDTQGLTLQTDSGSLFDYSSDLLSSSSSSVKMDPQHYLTSSHQGGATVSYQPQASRLAYLTPSPYLNPNPPEGSAPPPSYLTFGPGGGPGVVTYAAGGHTYFQAQTGGGQILLQSGIHGGITAYQSYPWDQLYSHPAGIQQRNQCSQFTTTTLGGRDHPTSSSYLPPTYYPRSHTLTHTSTQAQVLPPVSTLRHPQPRGVSAPQPRDPTPPLALLDPPTCVKAENESPPHIHSSHFHCDFSPILF